MRRSRSNNTVFIFSAGAVSDDASDCERDGCSPGQQASLQERVTCVREPERWHEHVQPEKTKKARGGKTEHGVPSLFCSPVYYDTCMPSSTCFQAHTALLSVTLLEYPNITYQLNMETAVRNITEMRRTRTFPFLYSERLKFQSSRRKYCRLKEVNESVKKLLYQQAQTESVLFCSFHCGIPLFSLRNASVPTAEFCAMDQMW